MQAVSYYLEQAERAERLANLIDDSSAKAELSKMAEDYRDIARDLENGAVEIRRPDLMRQQAHPR
jgi:hypothetical protein